MKKLRILILGVFAITLMVFLLGSFVSAQSTLGTIRGVALDESKAVVPGVDVAVRNFETNVTRQVVTGSTGDYEVTGLVPGFYEVTGELPGFNKVIVTDILLETSMTVRVNLELQVGDVATIVNVESTASVINTEGAEVASIQTQAVIQKLPINTRGTVGGGFYYTTLVLTPGAQRGQGSNFSLAGARGGAWGTSVDGITQNSPLFGNSIGPAQSSMEMTKELRVQLSNDKAESALPGGFYASSNSGSNDFHGSAFYYWSGTNLNARDPFSTSRPNRGEKYWGGSLGGPIIKDRTFFFFTFEKAPSTRERIFDSDLPTSAFKQGDFSSLLPNTVITNPFTGEAFPGNIIPQDLLSQTSQAIQSEFYPAPNTGGPNDFQSNWKGVGPGTLYKDQIEGRVDHQISDSNAIFGRLSWIRGGANVYDYNLITMPIREQDRRTTTLSISDTHTFGASKINELRFGFMRTENPAFNPLDGPALVQQFGLQGVEWNPEVPFGAPVFSYNNFQTIGASDIYQDPSESTSQIVDNFTWIHQNHTFKTGVEFRFNRGTNFPGGTSFPVRQFGDYRFNGVFSGFDYADFMLGLPQRSQRASAIPLFDMVNTDFAFFFQDDWKVSPRLTLNLGVRYDYNPPYHSKDGKFFNFDPDTGSMVVPDEAAKSAVNPLFPTELAPVVTAAEVGLPKSLWYSDLNNIMPRIGVAYRPGSAERLVIRGGYGLYTDYLTSSLWRLGTGGPFIAFETFNNSITDGVPLFQFPNAFPGGFGAIGAQSFDSINPRFKNPKIHQWNLTLEQEVFNTGLRVSYIGTATRQFAWIQNINQPPPSLEPFNPESRPFPDIQNITVRQNGATSNYHSLHVVAERKWRGGVAYTLGWTWAKNLTDGHSDSERGRAPENQFALRQEYGNVNYTNRHRIVGTFLWDLPFGAGKCFMADAEGAANHLVGGWSLSGILRLETGQFFSPSFSGFDVSNTNTFGGRPDRVGDGNLSSSERSKSAWFDVSAFKVPGDTNGDNRPDENVGRFGNAGVNILEGPSLFAINLGLFKTIHLTERFRIVGQATFTNALNHPNFRNPSGNIRSSSVGVIRQTHQRIGPRTGQVAIRLEF